MIIHGDCTTVMAAMDADSIDAIVTDPPYGLEFMGKEWDKPGWSRRMTGQKAMDHMVESGTPGPWARNAKPVMPWDEGRRNEKCRKCGHWRVSGTPCKCSEPDWELNIRTGAPPKMVVYQEFTGRWATEAIRGGRRRDALARRHRHGGPRRVAGYGVDARAEVPSEVRATRPLDYRRRRPGWTDAHLALVDPLQSVAVAWVAGQ